MLPLIGISNAVQARRNFDAEFERALREIAQAPQPWAPGSHQTRRFLLRRFPYLVTYREPTADTILVLAVAHTAANPDYWKGRT
jgi:plasmid stabilization system protein ParE